MIDTVLRQAKDVVLTPTARHLSKNMSPMTITLVGAGIGVLAALAGLQGNYALGLGLWLLNRTLDGLDGTFARVSGQQSDLGGYIDTMVDFAMYTIIPIGLALRHPTVDVLIPLVFLLGTFYINAAAFLYLSAILERRKLGAKQQGELTSITMPRGLIEGTEAVVFYSLFFLFPNALTVLFLLLGSLVIITTLQHVVWAVRNLE